MKVKQSGEWKELDPNYNGKSFEPFNVRWKHLDGTMSPIGSGNMREGSVLTYFQESSLVNIKEC